MIKGTRPILREAETRNTVMITAIVMGILRLSGSESLGILDIRSLRPRAETRKQAMLRFFLQALKVLQRNLLSLLSQSNSVFGK